MTDLDTLWHARFQEIADRAAHEIKDSLNGVVLNVEVARSRSAKPDVTAATVGPFAEAAASQLETLGRRVESLLFLARPARGSTDVAITLRHLAELLVPAANADGGSLTVEGSERMSPTPVSGTAVRLALAAGLLAVSPKGGRGKCVLEGTNGGGGTVVRFSHESAAACTLDPATAAALAKHDVRIDGSSQDLALVFPGNS